MKNVVNPHYKKEQSCKTTMKCSIMESWAGKDLRRTFWGGKEGRKESLGSLDT